MGFRVLDPSAPRSRPHGAGLQPTPPPLENALVLDSTDAHSRSHVASSINTAPVAAAIPRVDSRHRPWLRLVTVISHLQFKVGCCNLLGLVTILTAIGLVAACLRSHNWLTAEIHSSPEFIINIRAGLWTVCFLPTGSKEVYVCSCLCGHERTGVYVCACTLVVFFLQLYVIVQSLYGWSGHGSQSR